MTQRMARAWAKEEHLTIICGRYEGLDQRLFELFPLEAVSLGDVVLNGGVKPDEFAAFLRSGALNAAPTVTPYHKQEDAANET